MSSVVDARSEGEAIRQYLTPLEAAIAAFAENVIFLYSPPDPTTHIRSLTIVSGDAVLLQDANGDLRLALGIELGFRVVPSPLQPRRWTVETTKYIYRLEEPTLPVREIVAYHWHPEVPGISFPHIHMRTAKGHAAHLHVATPHATLREVFLTVMREYQVVPTAAHRHDYLDLTLTADETLQASMRWAMPT